MKPTSFHTERSEIDRRSAALLDIVSRASTTAFGSDGPVDAETDPTIYRGLASHQRSETWFGRELIEQLQVWAKRFNDEFKLDIPEIALRIDRLRRSRLGHFRYGHNGFGLRGEIAINALYVENREPWQVLGTLLHECLHAWQQAHGSPSGGNHHNREFRDKAASLGLLIDTRGYMRYAPDSLFFQFLGRYELAVPHLQVESPEPPRIPGQSKMKKWSCACTNIRCAVADLRGRCLKCGQMFVHAD
jgi:hypothetical protein